MGEFRYIIQLKIVERVLWKTERRVRMTDGAQIEYYIWNRKLKMNHVAQVLGISTSTLKNKLTGKTDFKVSEADTLSSLLELTPPQRDLCFFCGGRR